MTEFPKESKSLKVVDFLNPQGNEVPVGGEGNDVPVVPPDMTNGEIRETLLALARAMITNVNRSVEPRVNAIESTITPSLREFLRMNPHIFLVSKV